MEKLEKCPKCGESMKVDISHEKYVCESCDYIIKWMKENE